jgi:hypothetical protein
MTNRNFSNKVFTQLIEGMPSLPVKTSSAPNEGIVTSANEFLCLLQDANREYNAAFSIPEAERLVITEEFPNEISFRMNGNDFSGEIDEATQRCIRVVTYLVNEKPGSISSHKYDEEGIRTIKERLIDIREDTEHTGYSILRYGKEIEAHINFKVWGLNFSDIRNRSTILRKIIDLNTWYFKHKGLREIIWLGSSEWGEWDGANIIKAKSEKYLIKYVEIKELREKNIEQIIIQMGLKDEPTTTKEGEFFAPL